MSTNLKIANGWTVLGSFNSTPPFNQWNAVGGTPNAFYRAGYTDVDSDGDGIPDVLETCVYGTNPYNADTDGDGIGDYDEIYIYGTDPLIADTTPPMVSILTPVSGDWTAVLP